MENHHKVLEPLDIPQGYFEYLYPKNKMEDFHGAIQRVLADEIADGKIRVTLVKAKRVPAIHGMTKCG